MKHAKFESRAAEALASIGMQDVAVSIECKDALLLHLDFQCPCGSHIAVTEEFRSNLWKSRFDQMIGRLKTDFIQHLREEGALQ